MNLEYINYKRSTAHDLKCSLRYQIVKSLLVFVPGRIHEPITIEFINSYEAVVDFKKKTLNPFAMKNYYPGLIGLSLLLSLVLTNSHLFAQVTLVEGALTTYAPDDLTQLNGKLYFSAWRAETGREVYSYDPATKTVSLIADLIPGAEASKPRELTVVASKLYFVAGQYATFPRRILPALFEYDPLTNITRVVDRFIGFTNRGLQVSLRPRELNAYMDKLYLFSTQTDPFDGDYDALTIYDPSANKFEYVYGGYFFADFNILNSKIYFRGSTTWRFDGTDYSRDLFKYDVNTKSLTVVPAINQFPENLFAFDDKVFFTGYDVATGYELYAVDLVTNQITLVSDINSDSSSRPQGFTILQDKLYFQARGPQGIELFVYDPSTDTTSQVTDIIAGVGDSNPTSLFAFDNKLYFSANSPSHGTELFSFNPLNNEVRRAANIAPNDLSSTPGSFEVLNGELYFAASHPQFYRVLAKLKPAPIAILDLTLTSVCSDDPSVSRRWRIRNPNPVSVGVAWELLGTSQTGNITATPGDTFFSIATIPNTANTIKIIWSNEKGESRSATKASEVEQCGVEAGAVALRVYPNPSSDGIAVSVFSEADAPVSLQIISLFGEVAMERNYQLKKGENVLSEDITKLRPGVYVVKVGSQLVRFIKE